jgi:hypothetical protein
VVRFLAASSTLSARVVCPGGIDAAPAKAAAERDEQEAVAGLKLVVLRLCKIALESPLVPVIMDGKHDGVLHGKAENRTLP